MSYSVAITGPIDIAPPSDTREMDGERFVPLATHQTLQRNFATASNTATSQSRVITYLYGQVTQLRSQCKAEKEALKCEYLEGIIFLMNIIYALGLRSAFDETATFIGMIVVGKAKWVRQKLIFKEWVKEAAGKEKLTEVAFLRRKLEARTDIPAVEAYLKATKPEIEDRLSHLSSSLLRKALSANAHLRAAEPLL